MLTTFNFTENNQLERPEEKSGQGQGHGQGQGSGPFHRSLLEELDRDAFGAGAARALAAGAAAGELEAVLDHVGAAEADARDADAGAAGAAAAVSATAAVATQAALDHLDLRIAIVVVVGDDPVESAAIEMTAVDEPEKVAGGYRRTTSPSRLTRNFSKFHSMSPGKVSVSHT